MSYLDRQLRMQQSMVDQIVQIYRDAESRQKTHEWIMAQSREVFKRHPRANRITRTHVMGYEAALSRGLYATNACGYSPLVFAYEMSGEILPIDSPKYRAISPIDVNQNHTWHGYVWRLDPTKTFCSHHKKEQLENRQSTPDMALRQQLPEHPSA